MKPKALRKLAQHPGLFDRERLLAARDLYEFDNVFTAPLHGFRDTDDYWSRASAKPHLHRIRIPALVLNARNDPFVPAASLPRPHEVGPPRHAVAAGARRPRGLSRGPLAGPCAEPARGGDGLAASSSAERRAHRESAMDDIVKAALTKWPNVPHCYGWLALDARGDWYMRDDRVAGRRAVPAASRAAASSTTS